jgi:hypothetical protein
MSSINFNLNPYYDDFDETKNFYRVLFKPGYAVQARELTQLQTALQKQIERFGKHIFKEGAIVLGGQFNIETDVDTIRLTQTSGVTNTDLNSLVGKIIVGNTTGIRAYVHAFASKTVWGEAEDILLIRYLSSGTSSSTFVGGEQLRLETGVEPITYTVKATGATGKGSLFTIEDGTVFSKGYFVSFVKQKIILSPTSQTPTAKVGFDSLEEIIVSGQDTSLLDPALGSYNYSAPGADRLKVSLLLTKLDINDDTTTPDFTTLFIIKDGVVTELYERSEYSRIYDEFAKRTYDESGDYVVRGFGVRVREHLDTGSNEGYLSESNGGNVSLLAVGVEPGLAYVKGYEVDSLVTKYIETEKSLDFTRINSEVLSARNGNYITITQAVGSLDLDTAQTVTLYNQAEQRVSNVNSFSSTTPIGQAIGTAKVKFLEYSTNDQYDLYLFDINMTGSNTFSNVRSVYSSDNNGFFADVVLTSGDAVLQDTLQSTLLYPLGSDYIRSVRSDNDTDSDTSFTFKRSTDITINQDGTFSLEVTPSNETHSYGSSGSLSDIEKRTMILTLRNANPFSNVLVGTANGTISGNVLVGNGTQFLNLNVGDLISINNVTGRFKIASIANNVNLTITTTFPSSFTAQTVSKVYTTGDIIDLTGKGYVAGTERDVTAISNKILSFDLKETYPTTVPATIAYDVTRSSAKEIKKDLISSVYVQANCATLSSLTDPINLGISDVFRIKQIRKKTGTNFTSNTEGTLVTNDFVFDNGQRDDLYDHAKLIPVVALTTNDRILVELDYFKPDFTNGFGYFSIDSYPIDDDTESTSTIFTYQVPVYKSPVTGQTFNLRKYLDFRPVKTNTASDAFTPSGASVNPATTNSFNTPAEGLRIPKPASQISCDYSYYLARRDVVITDIQGNYSIIRGVPDIFPVTPQVPDDVMGIANLYIPPYPSLATTYARILNRQPEGVSIKRITNSRHTMRDIGVLKQRIENLEYYNALSLLEKSAVDLMVLDSSGNDRFKNGFFVDGFLDHSLGATYSSDYNIAVDKAENVIRPVFDMESFAYEYASAESTNVVKTGNLVTLPYTETTLLEQSRVTTIRNIEQSVFRFVGNITLSPDIDVWTDSTTVDRVVEFGNSIPPDKIMTTEWGSWETYQTGKTVYNVYARNYGDRSGDLSRAQLVGSFTSYADAVAASASVGTLNTADTTDRGYIEIVTPPSERVRTGIQTIATTEKIQQQIGTYVTDVSVIPYIRPQVINVVVRGLKANTTYYTFFDGEDMSDYITPRVLADSDDISSGTVSYLAEGAAWKTNSYGILAGLLRLPAEGKRFRVGSKEVIITDSPTNAIDATSYAKNYFYASGIYAQKQNTILSTRETKYITRPINESQTVSGKQEVQIFGPSCMAYSFKVEVPETEAGVFLTSVDVFIQQVHPTLGVWFEIREMSSDGGITRTQVPYSEVWYRSSEVTTTSDGTTPHNVKFQSPVFLQNNTQYAFVIHTEGLNPDTYFWVSRLGETDVITNTPVTGRQLTGSLFTTNNNLNWSIVPDVDLKVKFNRANFNTAVTGQAVFGNKPYEFLKLATPQNSFDVFGETIVSSQALTLTNIAGGTISVGNTITQGTNTANVLSISGSVYYTDGFSFNVGSIAASSGATANISAISSGSGNIVKYNSSDDTMILSSSNGSFFANATIAGSTSGNITTISEIQEYVHSTVNFKPRVLQLPKTTCTFSMSSILLSSNTYSTYQQFTPDTSFEFSEEKTLKSRTIELQDFSSSNSSLIKATLQSASAYVSPVVDVSATHCVFVQNLINSNTTGETASSGGSLINKYISKVVTLADGQDAEDLLVKLTAYLPPSTNSDIKVWMKIKNVEDGQEFNQRPWVEMTRNETVYSSLVNKGDFKEFTYSIPTSMLTGPNQEVQYTTSSGSLLTGFKQFSIKIGILGDDSAIVPRVGDLRAIALQK